MGAMPLIRGTLVRWCAVALLVVSAIALTPSAASAHAVVVRTSPANNSVLASAPGEVIVFFSEPVEMVSAKIRVIAPDDTRADRGTPRIVGKELHIPLRENLINGTYLATYRVISQDSHPIGGGITFSVGVKSRAPSGSGVSAGHIDRVVWIALPVARYAGYAGLTLLVGVLLVLQALWPARLSRRNASRLGWIGLGLVAVSAVLELYLQAPYSSGAGLFGATGDDFRTVLGDRFGQAHVVRLGVLAVLAAMLPRVFKAQAGVADRVLVAVLGVIGLATWPLAGHPGSSPVPALTTVADMAHLAAMAVWLGGLTMLSVFLLRQATPREVGVIMPVWSRWAALAVSVLVLAGTAQALVEVGSFGALFDTTYGRLVIAKVLLLGGVLVAANYSRRWVVRHATPRSPDKLAKPSVAAVGRLRNAVLVEVAVIAVVMGCTAALVQTTPARSAADVRAQQNSPVASWTITSSLYSLQFDLDPAAVGPNSVHLYAYDLNGKPLKVVEWTATAALPAKQIDPIPMALVRLADNHASGQVTFTQAGDWQLSFTLRLSEINEATVGQTVTIN
jgi:copper transport protein